MTRIEWVAKFLIWLGIAMSALALVGWAVDTR